MTPARSGWLAVVSFVVAVGADVRPARADVKEACATAYEQSQRMLRESRFELARGQLAICAQTCPDALVKDCERWSHQVKEAMPTVILEAKDKNGRPLTDARVSMDGRPLADQLDGRAVAVDPGAHSFRFEIAGAAVEETRTTLARGAKEQHIVVTFPIEAPAAPPPEVIGPATKVPDERHVDPTPPPAAGPSPAFYVLGALGVIGVGVGAGLGIKGHVDKKHLVDTCAPNCDQTDVDAIKTEWIIAGIAGGVGAIALGAAVVVLTSSKHGPPAGTSNAPGRATTRLRFQAARAGLGAIVDGSF